MSLVRQFVFNYAREVFDSCLMIAEPVIERTERVVVQWRRIGHDFEHAFAVFDHLSNLETVPAPFFFTQDRVSSDVEVEDSLHFTRLRSARAQPDHKNHSGDKHHDYG